MSSARPTLIRPRPKLGSVPGWPRSSADFTISSATLSGCPWPILLTRSAAKPDVAAAAKVVPVLYQTASIAPMGLTAGFLLQRAVPSTIRWLHREHASGTAVVAVRVPTGPPPGPATV